MLPTLELSLPSQDSFDETNDNLKPMRFNGKITKKKYDSMIVPVAKSNPANYFYQAGALPLHYRETLLVFVREEQVT